MSKVNEKEYGIMPTIYGRHIFGLHKSCKENDGVPAIIYNTGVEKEGYTGRDIYLFSCLACKKQIWASVDFTVIIED